MYENIYHKEELSKFTFLVTGGAGFIGSNLVEYLLKYGAKKVRVLDNLSTGVYTNIKEFESNSAFEFIKGDIRDLKVCREAVDGMDYILHQAALGSVPRSINDPITSNDVNVSGFLNMLVASRDAKVKRFIYAASSSTYGDSKELPKVEDRIGNPLSPYAITKYVNELYANVFSKTYGIETIGLRYFNVFGQKQNPEGAYAAVIPKFVIQLMKHESPVINGDGEYSRDFTYIENVVQANVISLFSHSDAINTVYNVAFGERTTLNQLAKYLKEFLSKHDTDISKVNFTYGSTRKGDVPHSLASIEKAKQMLGFNPLFSMYNGLKEAVEWYWNNLK
jgi:UDP-N-acetylglucosamine/UDP-N-acetylgalactosamine 4-epimerase